MSEANLAFIGGSGLYDIDGLEDIRTVSLDTPFGHTSDKIVIGSIEGAPITFLPRHGHSHSIEPTDIPARANIYALKSLGVERIVSISAVGSLQHKIRPLHLVIPDQLIDRTSGRDNSFFEEGIVAHVAMADPYCPALRRDILQSVDIDSIGTHDSGTCVVIDGPQFSTRAESLLYRSWNADIIGMTALPEARLAREAEICYATMAFVTDYDCWNEDEEDVSVEVVAANLQKNVTAAHNIIRQLATKIPLKRECKCQSALHNAIVTKLDAIPEVTRQRLSVIIDKYVA